MQDKAENENELLTPEQAAEVLQVSKRTMYEWLRNGTIPSEKIGERLIRVRRKHILSPDAKAFFEQGCQFAQNIETIDQAENCFRKAISLNPQYALAYAMWGGYLGSWGLSYRAIEPLEKAVELNPSFYNYNNLGLAYNNSGWFEKAEQALKNALELRSIGISNEQLSSIHEEIGYSFIRRSYFNEQNQDKAIDYFRKSLELFSNRKSAHFLGHIFLFYKFDYEQASLLASEIDESFPDEADHIRKMIQMYQKPIFNNQPIIKEEHTKPIVKETPAIKSAFSEKTSERELSTNEIGDFLGLSRRTVNDYLEPEGKLKSRKGKQGRNFIKLSDFRDFLEAETKFSHFLEKFDEQFNL